MEIRVFGTNACPSCKVAVRHVADFVREHNGLKFRYYDMETEDGLVEGALNEVAGIPTILVLGKDGVVARWSGELPTKDDLLREIKGFLH
jgi:thiol-disulfide isomerase/thioredoxin